MRVRPLLSPLVLAVLACAGGGGGGGGDGGSGTPRIAVDQVGYAPGAVKRAVVVGATGSTFTIRDAGSGAEVLSGDLEPAVTWTLSGEAARVADLSALETPGTYTVAAPGVPASAPFRIGADVYRAPALAALKAFYFWRASTALTATCRRGAAEWPCAGAWARAAGHPDDQLGIDADTHPATAGTARWSAPGGWYDAGDYGKYVVNAGFTVSTLLALEERHPGLVGDATGIPESGNGASDLLDEVKWELDWLLRMQDTDGGVFFKVAANRWSGWRLPANDETASERLLIGKSTGSALNFAAALAQAGRVYRGYQGSDAFAATCLAAARRAYAWAKASPSVAAPANTLGSGPYGDGDYADEFAWAAAELHATTGEASWLEEPALKAALDNLDVAGAADWGGVRNLAYYTLATDAAHPLAPAQAAALSAALLSRADAQRAAMAANPYGWPWPEYQWGSTAAAASGGILFLYAAEAAADPAPYRAAAVRLADQLLGANAVGRSFITGVGAAPPLHPHHRPSEATEDTVAAPVPGLVVGGPNQGRQDRGQPGVTYPDTHPAFCYDDFRESYSSNEPAINQNAAVVFLLGALDAAYDR